MSSSCFIFTFFFEKYAAKIARFSNVVPLRLTRLDCRRHELMASAVAYLDNNKIFAKGMRYQPDFFTVTILNHFTISHFIIYFLPKHSFNQ